MAEQTLVPLKDCTHVGAQVKDADKAMDFLSRVLGWGPWKNRRQGAERQGVRRDGKPIKFTTKGATVSLGGVDIDVIEPHGEGCLAEYVARGGGLHHLNFDVDDVEDAVAKLKKVGVPLLDAMIGEDGRWVAAFVDLEEACTGKIVLELLDRRFQFPKEQPAKSDLTGSQPVLPLRECTHVGIQVKDVDKAVDFLSRVFGWGPWSGQRKNSERRMVGRDGKTYTVSTSGAMVRLGDVLLDITESHGGGCREEFAARGGGLHHLNFDVDDVEDTVAKLEKVGVPLFNAAFGKDDRWLFAFADLDEVCAGKIALEISRRTT